MTLRALDFNHERHDAFVLATQRVGLGFGGAHPERAVIGLNRQSGRQVNEPVGPVQFFGRHTRNVGIPTQRNTSNLPDFSSLGRVGA